MQRLELSDFLPPMERFLSDCFERLNLTKALSLFASRSIGLSRELPLLDARYDRLTHVALEFLERCLPSCFLDSSPMPAQAKYHAYRYPYSNLPVLYKNLRLLSTCYW